MISKKGTVGLLLTCGLVFSGCETTGPQTGTLSLQAPLSSLNPNKKAPPVIAHIFKLIEEQKYTEASKFINYELQNQPKSSILHTLNGLTYEQLAAQGDASGLELASVGYQNAITLNPANIFAITQLGKIAYQEKKYDQAQELFANALLIKPDDPNLLHELAASSYYAYDIKTALAAIRRAAQLKPNDPLIDRSSTLIYAALGDFTTAEKYFQAFKKSVKDPAAVAHVQARLNDWIALYQSGRVRQTSLFTSPGGVNPDPRVDSPNFKSSSISPFPTVEAPNQPTPNVQSPAKPSTKVDSSGILIPGVQSPNTPSDDGSDERTEDDGSDERTEDDGSFGRDENGGGNVDTSMKSGSSNLSQQKSAKSDPKNYQIIVDTYLLRISENAETSKGNNILENLAVTLSPGGFTRFSGRFSGSAVPVGVDAVGDGTSIQYSPASSQTTLPQAQVNLIDEGSFSGRIFSTGVTWAGLTYNLNIANAINSRTQVVSRPTLLTFLNKKTSFFAGDKLVVGLSGQFGATLIKYPIGVTIEITPLEIEGEYVTMKVSIDGTLLTSPNTNLQQTVQVGEATIETFVKLRLGETLMLGGLYESVELDIKKGFPGLKDLPIVQYLFSNEATQSLRRTVMAMITPRSPDAVKTAVKRAMTRGPVRPHLDELLTRQPNWFNTEPNMISIFNAFSKDPILYYEFRTGDILPPSWGWEPPLKVKLDQLAAFLYF